MGSARPVDEGFAEGLGLQIFSLEGVAEALSAARLVPGVAVVELAGLADVLPDVVGAAGEVLRPQLEGLRLCVA